MNKGIAMLTGAGIGAAAMFMLDPAAGRRRRALVRDKAVSGWKDASGAVAKTSRDVGNRARGVAASARGFLNRGFVPDPILRERVRARIGRAVSHPGAVDVVVRGGVVTLSGPVLAAEAAKLVSAAEGVRGVGRVENRLDVHETAENISSLQGDGRLPRRRGMPPAWRVGAGAAAGVLAILGVRRLAA
jgi:hypothetical protein